MKLRAAEPAALEAVPEQDCIHLPGELVHPPHAAILNDLTGRIERQTVQPTERVNFIPVLADITVLQRDMVLIRPSIWEPTWPSSSYS
jgi:hypothetical protein